MCIRDRYNSVVDINFTACKIVLNNFVKKYNDCQSSSVGKVQKERKVKTEEINITIYFDK